MSVIANDINRPKASNAKRRTWLIWTGAILAGLIVLGAIWFVLMMRQMADENTPPPDLDVSHTRASAQGLYSGTYTPSFEPITIDKLHSWTLHLETADGKPVENATIAVHGDMPGHGHGLPTKPIVSEQGNGDYLVEGMKFQMHGWWYVEYEITANGTTDTLRFDFLLK